MTEVQLPKNNPEIQKPKQQEEKIAPKTENYTYDKNATDKFEAKDDWKSWLEKNNSRLGQAIVNPDNDETFKDLVMDELITQLYNAEKGRNYVKQLLFIKKYGSGKFQKKAKEASDEAKRNVYGELPDIVDPTREEGVAVEDANTETLKKAALADYELFNHMMTNSLTNVLEAPMASIPRWKVLEENKKIMNSEGKVVDSYRVITWSEVSNQILAEVEAGQTDKILNRLRANIQASELDAIKLTLELLKKYALGEIRKENVPMGHDNAINILNDINKELLKDEVKAQENFAKGDIQALNTVIGYASVAKVAHEFILDALYLSKRSRKKLFSSK